MAKDNLGYSCTVENVCVQNAWGDVQQLLNNIQELCSSMDVCNPIRDLLQQSARTINVLKNTQEEILKQFRENQALTFALECDIREKNNELFHLSKAYKFMEKHYVRSQMRIDEITNNLFDNNKMDCEKNIKNELKDIKYSLVMRMDENETLNRQICEKDQTIEENGEIIEKLQSKLNDLEKYYDDCKLSKINNDKKMVEMNAKILEQKNIIIKGENDNCYKTNYIANLENTNDDLQKVIRGLEDSITVNKKLIQNLQEKLNTLNNIHNEQKSNLFCDIEKLSNKIKELKSKHSTTKKELENIQAEKVCLIYEKESLEQQIRSLENQLFDSKNNNDELKDKLSCYILQIKELKRINVKLNENIENQKKKYDDQTIKALELNDKIETLQHEINSMIQKNNTLSCDYKKLNENYNDVLNKYDIKCKSFININNHLSEKINELQSKDLDLSTANEIITGNNGLILSFKRNLNCKSAQWKQAELDLQDLKIKLNEEISMKKKIQEKYLKLKHEQVKCYLQDKCANNCCARNTDSVISSCHETTKCQTETITELQWKLDNQSLEMDRYNIPINK